MACRLALARDLHDFVAHDVSAIAVQAQAAQVVSGRAPDDALAIARRARELGFQSTAGILHDDRGRLVPLGAPEEPALRRLLPA